MERNWSAREMPRQDGKRVVVTGSNSGIGFHTALELGRAGAEVILAVREVARGEEAKAKMLEAAPGASFTVEALDLASLASVRAFAARLTERGQPLDILINNAGVMALPERELTGDGYERQVATNHLGHFALTALLLPLLAEAPAPRVVTVSSAMAYFAKVDVDDLQSERRYAPMRAYGISKLSNLLFMLELDRRFAEAGILSVAAHPGSTTTNLQKYAFKWAMPLFGQTADVGALPTLYAAVGDDVAGGTFFGPRKMFGMWGPPSIARLPKRAKDEAVAAALWDRSLELTGVAFPALPARARAAKAA